MNQRESTFEASEASSKDAQVLRTLGFQTLRTLQHLRWSPDFSKLPTEARVNIVDSRATGSFKL